MLNGLESDFQRRQSGRRQRAGLNWSKYPWGDDPPNGTQCNLIEFTPIGEEFTNAAPVGSFPANGYGLYDMAGNVKEWCLDAYQEDFYSSSPRRNPIAGANSVITMINNFANKNLTNISRVLRGGFSFSFASYVRVAYRGDYVSTRSLHMVPSSGFRCVRSVTP